MSPILDTSPRQLKMMIIKRVSGCSMCSPHKGCNRSYKKYRVKKQWKTERTRGIKTSLLF